MSIEEILKYLAIIGATISFIIGLFKWIDQRNREIESRLYKTFHQTICRASGKDENGKGISMLQQIGSIYQLQKFKQYAFASIPVLELMKFEFKELQINKNDHRYPYLMKAIEETITQLKNK
ncbi:MAG: hypothetical protein L3J20_04540 [Flavobacteriaceae bacterium]|nr:hypothetical protein [Flavobacteriaceae bacterium]